jgi:hypothetical protein
MSLNNTMTGQQPPGYGSMSDQDDMPSAEDSEDSFLAVPSPIDHGINGWQSATQNIFCLPWLGTFDTMVSK